MKKTLKVALVVDAWFPKVAGKQVHISALRHRLHRYHRIKTELYYLGRKNLWFQVGWPFWMVRNLVKHHRIEPYSLIHSHGVIAGLPAKIASVILKIPVIHTVHGSPHLDQKSGNFQAILESWLLTKVKYDRQISVSQNFAKYKNINAVTVIPNGVDVAAFDAIRVRKYDHPSLIWVGNNLPEKGVSVLKEAITKVRKKIPKLHTELVTGGRLTGQRLIKAYKRSHLFVLPSLAEGRPIALLEAWAAKLPVIATNVGDNSSLIKHGENGLLVEPDNVKQLASAILKVLRSRTKGKPMGQRGYRYVKKHVSWRIVTKATVAVYQQTIKHYAQK